MLEAQNRVRKKNHSPTLGLVTGLQQSFLLGNLMLQFLSRPISAMERGYWLILFSRASILNTCKIALAKMKDSSEALS